MLLGINPLLNGDLLRALDHMGHADSVLITDAHYPVYSVGAPVIELPVSVEDVTRAVCSVLPIDEYDGPAAHFMTPEPGTGEVQQELRKIVGVPEDRFESLERFTFYDYARRVSLVIRTGDTRKYANILLRKGVVA